MPLFNSAYTRAHEHMLVYVDMHMYVYAQKGRGNEKSPGGGTEEHNIVRMPSIIFGTHSFKTQFILYSFIYLCLCMLVCVGAYIFLSLYILLHSLQLEI